jgi:hypothetical protein
LKQDSNKALNEIGQLREAVNRQQKELTETGVLLKDLASRSAVEGFSRNRGGQNSSPPGDFVIVTRTANSHALAMRLRHVPYPETVRVQWNVAVQPPDSYLVNGNVVMLPYWEDSADRLSERRMFVSYIADAHPAPENRFFKVLSVRENAIFGDEVLLLPSVPPRRR